MAEVFVGIGSNVDPVENIRGGLQSFAQHFSFVRLSSVYESEAVGFAGRNFLNLVAHVRTDKSTAELQKLFKKLEQDYGRPADAKKFSPRTLDLDLLLYDECVQAGDGAWQPTLPREEILTNAFVLLPLAEIAPHRCHPVNGVSFLNLWQTMRESTEQALWPIQFDWSVSNEASPSWRATSL